ncbi:helix-turn-helix domain-containing protein [Allochromatium palmeri]|uniref:Helix-turn-helix domain-containing protein n=1 Tax=Allochromatium palmeri TaxID=231048 RepID=A0A6N8EG22_9GAMM|nr:helix-turn-helix transcriptional regulator [Allochromatium palmeri]MTW22611.1 helix-turn-helix domain-containing protein [Allochromatium palmeri]
MDSRELTNQIGERLRAERKAQDLSMSELSERTGGQLSKSRISNYEQGIRRMGLEESRILSEALGTVSPMYLLCLEDEREIETLRQLFLNSDPTGRRLMVAIAKEIHDAHQACYTESDDAAKLQD